MSVGKNVIVSSGCVGKLVILCLHVLVPEFVHFQLLIQNGVAFLLMADTYLLNFLNYHALKFRPVKSVPALRKSYKPRTLLYTN